MYPVEVYEQTNLWKVIGGRKKVIGGRPPIKKLVLNTVWSGMGKHHTLLHVCGTNLLKKASFN